MSQQQQQPSSSSSSSSSVSKSSSSYVLYVNDEYQPIPLLQCYHSIASKSLCSSNSSISSNDITANNTNTNHYPNTILKQIDSYYCCNCLQNYDKIQSINTPYYGTCNTCYTCPFCITSIVCIQYNEIIKNTNTNNDINENQQSTTLKHFNCYYQCNNCDYSSNVHNNISIQLSLQIYNPNATTGSNDSTRNSNNNNVFTKWETLQKSAIEQLNNMIRQQYYMSITENMNHIDSNKNYKDTGNIDATNSTNTSKVTLQYYYYLLNEWKLYYSTTQQQQQYKSSSSKSLLLNTTTKTNIQPPTIKPSTNTNTNTTNNNNNTKNQWSMEELEMKLKSIQQQQQTKLNVSSNHSIISNQEDDKSLLQKSKPKYNHNSIRRTSIHYILRQQQQQQKEQEDNSNTKNKYEHISLLSYLIQCMLYHTTTTTGNDTIVWYPIPLLFHIRYTYRSKKDVIVYHRPGIVLKSKLNPLDGDSNGNTTLLLNNTNEQLQVHNIGQWFRKDSSAIYTIPNIQIIHHTITTTTTKMMKHSFIIQVSNPTLNNIRIRLSQSKYQGEIDYWNEQYDDTNTKIIVADRTSSNTDTTTTYTNHCRHVLFDTIESIGTDQLSLLLNIPINNMSSSSSTIELLSMDDTFLVDDNTTLHSSNRIPDMIQHWDTTNQLQNDTTFTTNDNNTLRFITQNRSMAWYELIMNIPQNHDDNQISSSYGIPIALEIFDTIQQQEQTQTDTSTNTTTISSSNERNDNDDVVDVYDVVLVWTELDERKYTNN